MLGLTENRIRHNPSTWDDTQPISAEIFGPERSKQHARSLAETQTVTDRPVRPADVCCTVYEALGIDPRKQLLTPEGRPVEILDQGETMKELYT